MTYSKGGRCSSLLGLDLVHAFHDQSIGRGVPLLVNNQALPSANLRTRLKAKASLPANTRVGSFLDLMQLQDFFMRDEY
jgi:hypothetical protein